MLKRTITYTDFNGIERTEAFYFNLSKAELAEWQLRDEFSGGLRERLTEISASKDGGKIMDTFREILSKAYGIKSDDGRTFTKSEAISQGFMGSEAYSVLFMELISDPAAAAQFINGIVPAEFSEGANLRDRMQNERPQPQDHRQAQPRTVELPTAEPQFNQPAFPQTGGQPAFPHVPQNQQHPYRQPADAVPMQPYPQNVTHVETEYLGRPPHEQGQQNQQG